MGGGEIALLHLAANLDRSRFAPIVLLGADGDLRARLVDFGVETHVLPLDPDIVATRKDSLGPRSALLVGTVGRLMGYTGQLARFLRANSLDILHTNSLKSDILGGIAGRRARVPVIWHVRDRIAPDYLPRSVVKVFRRLCRHMPSYVIANSAATLDTILPEGERAIGKGDADARYRVVHDAVGPSYALRATAPSAHVSVPDAPRIGLVGRITPWKGQDVFIRAAQCIRTSFPGAEFLIIGSAMFGEDAYEAELRRLVEECGLQQSVKFLGFRSDVEELIDSLDVLVHASVVPEPFGQVVIEGMAAGKPVVATRGGGVIEIVEDGVTGKLVTMGSAEEMAEAVLALLCDAARAGKMAAAARQAVLDRFTIKSPVEKVQALYDAIARRRQPSGRRA